MLRLRIYCPVYKFGELTALGRLRPELYAIGKNPGIIRGNGNGEKRALKSPPYSMDEAYPKIGKKGNPDPLVRETPRCDTRWPDGPNFGQPGYRRNSRVCLDIAIRMRRGKRPPRSPLPRLGPPSSPFSHLFTTGRRVKPVGDSHCGRKTGVGRLHFQGNIPEWSAVFIAPESTLKSGLAESAISPNGSLDGVCAIFE